MPQPGPAGEAASDAEDARDPRRQWRHDALLHELEDRSPEGRGPRPRLARREWLFFGSLAVIAAGGGGIALHCLGGWIAVGVGGVLLVAFYVLGWWPYVMAAFLRQQEHERFEAQVERQLHEPPEDAAGRS